MKPETVKRIESFASASRMPSGIVEYLRAVARGAQELPGLPHLSAPEAAAVAVGFMVEAARAAELGTAADEFQVLMRFLARQLMRRDDVAEEVLCLAGTLTLAAVARNRQSLVELAGGGTVN